MTCDEKIKLVSMMAAQILSGIVGRSDRPMMLEHQSDEAIETARRMVDSIEKRIKRNG